MKFAFVKAVILTLSAGFFAGSAFAKTITNDIYCNVTFGSTALEQETVEKTAAQASWIAQLRSAFEDRNYRVVVGEGRAALRVEAVSFFCNEGGSPQVPCTNISAEMLITDLESVRASRIAGEHSPPMGRASRAVAFSSMVDAIPQCRGPKADAGKRTRF